jgi:aryl carrier-like protein
MARGEVLEVLRAEAAGLAALEPDDIPHSEPLAVLGLDSIKVLELQGRIEDRFGVTGLAFTPAAELLDLADQVEQAMELAGNGAASGDSQTLLEGLRVGWRRLRQRQP